MLDFFFLSLHYFKQNPEPLGGDELKEGRLISKDNLCIANDAVGALDSPESFFKQVKGRPQSFFLRMKKLNENDEKIEEKKKMYFRQKEWRTMRLGMSACGRLENRSDSFSRRSLLALFIVCYCH